MNKMMALVKAASFSNPTMFIQCLHMLEWPRAVDMWQHCSNCAEAESPLSWQRLLHIGFRQAVYVCRTQKGTKVASVLQQVKWDLCIKCICYGHQPLHKTQAAIVYGTRHGCCAAYRSWRKL